MNIEDSRKQLRESGIQKSEIEKLLDAIEKTLNTLFDEFEIECTNPDEATEYIHEVLLQQIIEISESNEKITLAEQFEKINSDYTDPQSETAKISTVFLLGVTSNSTKIDSINELSEEILKKKYVNQ